MFYGKLPYSVSHQVTMAPCIIPPRNLVKATQLYLGAGHFRMHWSQLVALQTAVPTYAVYLILGPTGRACTAMISQVGQSRCGRQLMGCRSVGRQEVGQRRCQRLLDKLRAEQTFAQQHRSYPAKSCPICFEDLAPAVPCSDIQESSSPDCSSADGKGESTTLIRRSS